MTIQDYDVTYDELEPYFDKFEYLNGTSGRPATCRGKISPGGNPFEGPRSRALSDAAGRRHLSGGPVRQGSHSSWAIIPSRSLRANCSEPFTNSYNVRLGPCNLCGFCERFGCFLYSKGSPQTTILPALAPAAEFRAAHAEPRHQDQPRFDRQARHRRHLCRCFRCRNVPAGGSRDPVVIPVNNVRMMLLSGIGEPYDPATGAGMIGKNFAYQMMSATAVFYDKDVPINPFIGAGSGGSQIVDEFNSDHFDHGPHGFVGGGYIIGGQTGGRPIQQLAVPPGTPGLGRGMEARRQGQLSSHHQRRHPWIGDVVPRRLSRSRSDLSGFTRQPAAADDLRLA